MVLPVGHFFFVYFAFILNGTIAVINSHMNYDSQANNHKKSFKSFVRKSLNAKNK